MINNELIYEIYKIRKGDPQFCFKLNKFLGPDGLYENHEFKGKTFIKKEDNKEYTVDNVYVHYYNGEYRYAVLAQNNKSHTVIDLNFDATENEIYFLKK